jgi:hypothetical protein
MRQTLGRLAAVAAAAALPLTILAAPPASAYTINTRCGPWHDNGPLLQSARACATVRSTNIPGDSLRGERVRLCIQGSEAVEAAWTDARVYDHALGVVEFPTKSGDCVVWDKDWYVDDDDVRVRVWGLADVPLGEPEWSFNIYVPIS